MSAGRVHSLVVAVASIVLLVPTTSAGQQTDGVPEPRAALTVGMGAAYGGFAGILGEIYLGRPRLSLLVGAGRSGASGSCLCSAVSGSLRGYSGGSGNRLYIDVTGVYLVDDDEEDVEASERFMPVVLVGYANVLPSGFTLNAGIGVARNRYRDIVPALDVGVGYTWGGHPAAANP